MKARHLPNGFRRRNGMEAQVPKTAGSNASPFPAADSLYPLPPTSIEAEGTSGSMDAAGPTWHVPVACHDSSFEERSRICPEKGTCARRDALSTIPIPCAPCNEQEIPEQLAQMLATMVPGPEGEELADAFRSAGDIPPVTKQSLSELDIQNIITNIKLRHDVNFDRDLSFRPNLDGAKGQEKMRNAATYWKALVAELELYARLFQGTPPLSNQFHTDLALYVRHAERRIPKMFETIHDVLKSLVPDRDHCRVDEHLDVPMLMQEIERGVCDLVRLAQWMAHLLKEHCAPMRDILVDKMVQITVSGVEEKSSTLIVASLRELLGILESMKLDVANHQIRNLRELLIEDTTNFEKHYHLDRLVGGRAKVNVDSAQKWWTRAVAEFRPPVRPSLRDISRAQLEVFSRAVVASLCARDSYRDLPDTFYLDYDRLRLLKSEITDLVHFDICFAMFTQLLKEFGHEGPVSQTARHHLRTSLLAIAGESSSHSPQSWIAGCESLSLEIYRQAWVISGRSPNYSFEELQKANQHLRALFLTSYAQHAAPLEATLLAQVLACANRYHASSPVELFNNLVAPSPTPPPHASFQPLAPLLQRAPNDLISLTSSFQPEKLTNIANRITHILLLHWRIWCPIAYIQDEGRATLLQPPQPTQAEPLHLLPTSEGDRTTNSPPPPAPTPPPPPPPPPENIPEAQVVGAMKTGDPPDPLGMENSDSVAEDTRHWPHLQ